MTVTEEGPCNASISKEGYWTCTSGPGGTPCGGCRRLAAGLDEVWDDDRKMFVDAADLDGPPDDDWIHGAYERMYERLDMGL